MGVHVIKMPDVGEGVAEAELVEWRVSEGQNVCEDEVLAAVMTDKATVEIPSPVEGKVVWLGAAIGDIVAVGSQIIRLEVEGAGNKADDVSAPPPSKPAPAKTPVPSAKQPAVKPTAKTKRQAPPASSTARADGPPRAEGENPLASPAVRKRALDAGVDLRRVRGTGPAGRISNDDLDRYLKPDAASGGEFPGRLANTPVKEIPVIGLRRKIAEKMTVSRSRIPDIVYVEEIDVTALEELRAKLNSEKPDASPKLTLLPFLMRAMASAIADRPEINSTYDDEAGVIYQYGAVHVGVATQTDNGLMVPVVRHVEARGLWDCGAEVARLAEAAKKGTATREQLSGSTITITSLGPLGGVVTTPVINHPEVAIIGVNRIRVLPQWDGTKFVPRKMMNLSSSFDHRVVDGWNAAVFVQKIKTLLENPAMIFVED